MAAGAQTAAIFVCLAAECGLRFPVAAGDAFDARCPRCHGDVVQVETITPRAIPRPAAPSRVPALHLLLDNWRSLFNTGAAFRTADGAGVRHVHLCGITPTPAQRKLAKTALGAETSVPWSYAPNGVQRAAELRAQGCLLWVLEGGAESQPLWAGDPALDRPLVLAAGNEVVGVDPGLAALADRVVHLPMLGHKESLNVAIALSVVVYWLVGRAYAPAVR